MATKKSTGLCNKMMGGSGANPFQTLFNLGFIKIYAGTPPDHAHDDIGSATLLCTVSNNSTGTGLTFDDPTAGVLPKKASETWSGVNAASGTASFFRLVPATNTTGASSTECRIQGTVGTGGTDMVVGNPVFTSGATFTLAFFTESLLPD